MTQLFDMGGYELYVWSCVGLGLAVFIWNALAPRWQRRAVMTRLEESDEESGTNGDAT
ncbi:MAG: heme exporter protein CcmD [Panacagrimonas sp.]